MNINCIGVNMERFLSGLTLLAVCLSSVTVHAEWTGSKQIQTLKVQPNGTYMALADFQNQSSVVCGTAGFWLSNTEQNYAERTSFLLAAFLAARNVNISFYECSGSHIRMGSVQLREGQ
jgi:hypothetical protein